MYLQWWCVILQPLLNFKFIIGRQKNKLSKTYGLFFEIHRGVTLFHKKCTDHVHKLKILKYLCVTLHSKISRKSESLFDCLTKIITNIMSLVDILFLSCADHITSLLHILHVRLMNHLNFLACLLSAVTHAQLAVISQVPEVVQQYLSAGQRSTSHSLQLVPCP